MKRYILYIFFLLLSAPSFSQKIIGIGKNDSVSIFNLPQSISMDDSITTSFIWIKNWGTQSLSGQCDIYAAVDSGFGGFHSVPLVITNTVTTNLNLNPGDSIMCGFRMQIQPSNFRIGPDVIVIWPVMVGTITQDSAWATIIVTEPSSVVQIGNDKKLKVYPNPVIDAVHFNEEGEQETIEYVKITDISGRFVKELFNKNVIPMDEYKTGTYLLEVHFKDNSVKTYKVVKE